MQYVIITKDVLAIPGYAKKIVEFRRRGFYPGNLLVYKKGKYDDGNGNTFEASYVMERPKYFHFVKENKI